MHLCMYVLCFFHHVCMCVAHTHIALTHLSSIGRSTSLIINLPIYLPIYLYLSIDLSIDLSTYLPTYLPTHTHTHTQAQDLQRLQRVREGRGEDTRQEPEDFPALGGAEPAPAPAAGGPTCNAPRVLL